MLLRATLLVLLVPLALGHVKLVYPAARAPALDYYSSANSRAPCGVEKPAPGQGLRTYFKSGSMIELEWFIAVPHMGGIRLEVLNSKDEPIAIFTNFNESFNVTESSKKVELPANFECANCAIRLTSQASEYGDSYFFYSCADVNIVKQIPDGDTCLGHGQRQNGQCVCTSGYYGDSCQHLAECRDDDDCGVQGLCKTVSDSASSRQCYCPISRFGRNCQEESDTIRTISDFDPSLYHKKQDKDNLIYWRLLKDEIEFVLQYPGESWVALGWKSPNAECELTAADFPMKTQEEHDCGPNEMWSDCPESSRECEHSCDWTKFPETTPNCPNSCGAPRCICKEGFVRISNEEETCVPFEFCNSGTAPTATPTCAANSTWAKCGTACEPTCANMYDTAPCPATCEKPACTCADNYVRHNGECIYWGDCPEVAEKSQETTVAPTTVTITTRKPAPTKATLTSTIKPVAMPECSLNETISECGRVCEPDCVSIFTRAECNDCGSAACACIQGYARNAQGQCVYWGDCPSDGVQTTSHTEVVETTTAEMTTTVSPAVNGDVCYGDFRYPGGCSDCDYKLAWNYLEDSDEIEFSIETRLSDNSWTGVGFSEDGTMNEADFILLTSKSGKLAIHDMTSRGYDVPQMDAQQDVRLMSSSHSNGVVRAQFARKRNTGDSVDKQFSESQCWKMLYPIAGGKLDQYGNISIHLNTPLTSDADVCIQSCQKSKPHQDSDKTSCDTEFRYPDGCKDNECDYHAKWEYDASSDDVRFEISSRTNGRWTGIGFSSNGEMTNADVYTGWVYEGKAYITDRFAYGRQLPAIDPSDRNDIYDVSGRTEDDIQTISFRRKLVTSDTKTDVRLDECQYFLFPVGGGRVLARKSSDFTNPKTPIGYHDQVQPQVSPTKICLKQCSKRSKRAAPKTSAMHCADIVVGSVVDGRARVVDMFSPSKATPMPDEWFGGVSSLTSAAAFQADGVTTLVFRKPIRASEKWDNSFVTGPMTVIWAKGVNPSAYVHTTGGAPIRAPETFFDASAFKYHGKDHRGVMTIDFFENEKQPKTVHGMNVDASTCTGVFEGCSKDGQCDYKVSWVSDGSVARFNIHTKIATNHWTALGFSTDGNMAAADAVLIGVTNTNTITVTDQFMPNYGRPIVDEQQDIFDVETALVDGFLTANFSRELYSDDDEHDVDLRECVYLLYTPVAGVIEANGEIRKHHETPMRSEAKICLNKCTTQKPVTIPTTSSMPESSTTMATTTTEVVESTTTTIETVEESTEATTVGVPTTKSTSTTTTKVQMPPMTTKRPYIVYKPEEEVKKRYGLWVRILNREFSDDLRDQESPMFQSFTKDVTKALDALLAKRWTGMRVSKIIGYEKGSVIGQFEVVATNQTAATMELKSLIEENAVRGAIAGFNIEPTTVKVTDSTIEPSDEEKLHDWAMWRNVAIVALCSVFVFVFVCLMCCLMCRCRRRSTYSAYPVADAHIAYGARMMGEKAGFDNAIYHQNPHRYYSQTTVASTKLSATPPTTDSSPEVPPSGVGETTYQEWYSKVGSKPASQKTEEAPIATTPSRPPSTTPYVSYPNDPTGYYTLGGKNRTSMTSNKYQKY